MQTHVSAPGKVLLAGGYLVLDRKYSGLVIGMDSRMHCLIDKNHSSKISVRSPQFSDGEWEYILDGCNVIPTNGSNEFVQISLAFVCHLIGPNRIWGLDIRFMADNDFYSQSEYLTSKGLDPTLENLKLVPKFNATGSKIATVSKTGLGTSATLVSALVAGLLIHFCVISPLGSKILPHDLGLIEKISQICHSAAQGKVGSGFDISAACHGSHIYTRFSPSLIEPFLDTPPNSYAIPELLQQPWDHKVISSRLPKGISILLVEVCQGTNTPQMVSKVMEWFNNTSNLGMASWNSIYETQSEFINCLRRLHTMECSPQYDAILNNLSDKVISTHSAILDSPIENAIVHLSKAGMEYRRKMKVMGLNAGVEVEPDSQTKIIYDGVSQSGVIIGSVPGAGGYDAIYFLTIGRIARNKLCDYLTLKYRVTPLLCEESSSGLIIEDSSILYLAN